MSQALEDAILVAILQGAETADEISRILRVDKGTIEDLLRKLELEGYVKSEIKGLLFKKKVYLLTEKGFERASKVLEKIKEVANQVRVLAEQGRVDEATQIINTWSYFVPLMLWMDLIPLTLLPLELGFIADAAAWDQPDYSDYGGDSGDGGDTGDADTGDSDMF